MNDLIERQAAIDALKEKRDSAKEWYEEASASGDEMSLARAESAMMTFIECSLTIKKLPSVTPQRTGKWIDDNCSECGFYVHHGDMRNYCPKCGAKMIGGKTS